MRLIELAVVLAVLWQSAARAELGPVRPEFQLSTDHPYSPHGYNQPHDEAQYSIDIAASSSGTFVVAWEDLYQYINDYSRPGIFARRLDDLGRPLAGEFRASPFTAYVFGSSHVASDAAGDFVVVWDETGYDYTAPADSDGLRIMARHYNASGGEIGPPFQVNTFTTGGQYTPKVAFDGAGNFVVVWATYKDYYAAVLEGQKYSAAGAPIGGEFQVNSNTSCCIGYTGYESSNVFDDVDIAGDEAGNFVVVWKGPPSAGSYYDDIVARFFDSTGAPRSDQFAVNSSTTTFQGRPTVAPDHQGHFIVSWAGANIYGRRYDAIGTPLGGEFKVNSSDPFYQYIFGYGPSVAADATGRFVVVWAEQDDTRRENTVMAREFDSTGAPVADEFRVADPDAEYPVQHPRVAASAAGDFMVVWAQYSSYGSYRNNVWSAVGRRLEG